MARRPEAQEPVTPAARRREPEQPSAFDSIRWGRLVAWVLLGMIVLVGTLFAWHRTEEFLIRDDRFRLKEPQDFAGQSPSLIVEGIRYASPAQIRHVFAPDFGRSLYLVPISERRQQLMAIDWVEEATVSKIWPNTLKIRVQERTPIAFVHLPPNRRNGMSEFALIDKDGFILRPKIAARFRLPVVNGLMIVEFALGVLIMAVSPIFGLSVVAATVLSIGGYGFLPAYTTIVATLAPPRIRARPPKG